MNEMRWRRCEDDCVRCSGVDIRPKEMVIYTRTQEDRGSGNWINRIVISASHCSALLVQ